MFARLFFSHGKWNVNIMLNVSFCVFRKKESHTCLDDSSKKNSVKSDSNSSWSFYCDFHLYNMTTDLGVAFFHSLEQSLTDCRIIVSLVLTNSISPDYFKRASVFLWVSLIYQWYWHCHNKSNPYFHLFIGQLVLLITHTRGFVMFSHWLHLKDSHLLELGSS